MNDLEIIKGLKETECSCEQCQNMCKEPCCPTPDEVEKLIEAGYSNRFSLDDWDCDVNPKPMIKPALKGYEQYRAPFETKTEEGCTFWKEGKCELHDTGLKPMHAKYSHHSTLADLEVYEKLEKWIKESWGTEKATKLIETYKEKFHKGVNNENI